MSLGEADAKFPGQSTGLPPPRTAENPGQVYPKSSPHAAPPRPSHGINVFGNPFLLNDALDKVDRALLQVMDLIDKEEISNGRTVGENPMYRRFENWRAELAHFRNHPPDEAVGSMPSGMFTD